MKKLTDKDAILCVSIEEAIAIRNKFGLDIEVRILKSAFKYHKNILMYSSGNWSGVYAPEEFKITKASKILNKGVSKKEFLRRIEKLEKVMIDNTELTVSKTPEIEGIKNELTELPEKWYIKITEENIKYLNEYLNNYKSKYKGSTEFWKVDSIGYYFLSENKKEYYHSSYKKPKGYTEISFEQFKKWVLKEDDSTEIPKITEVQVDCSELTKEQIKELSDIVAYNGEKNYKSSDSLHVFDDYLYFRYAEDSQEHYVDFAVYPFNKNKKTITYQQFKDFYSKEKPLSIREVQVKVNSQEEAKECAEISKHCGEKVWYDNQSLTLLYNKNYFRKENTGNDFGVWRFNKKLKEISLQEFRELFGKPKEIDWSKAGQLVESDDYVVGIIMSISQQHFKGFLLKIKEFPNTKNDFEPRLWDKEAFKLCTEPITLSN